jgi:hypothetical protein
MQPKCIRLSRNNFALAPIPYLAASAALHVAGGIYLALFSLDDEDDRSGRALVCSTVRVFFSCCLIGGCANASAAGRRPTSHRYTALVVP